MATRITEEEALHPEGVPVSAAQQMEKASAGLELLEDEDLSDQPFDLEDGGGPLLIGPMRMGQIRRFLVEAGVLLPSLKGLFREAGENGQVDIDVQAIASIDQDAFYRAICIASKIDMERLDELRPDVFVRLVARILVCNMDFFVRQLPQSLEAAVSQVTRAAGRLSGAGRTPSKS